MYYNREEQRILGLWESVGFANIEVGESAEFQRSVKGEADLSMKVGNGEERRNETAKDERYWPRYVERHCS